MVVQRKWSPNVSVCFFTKEMYVLARNRLFDIVCLEIRADVFAVGDLKNPQKSSCSLAGQLSSESFVERKPECKLDKIL